MKTSDFDYELPDKFIAQNPVVPRDASRLMVYDTARDEVHHKTFRDIRQYLSNDDVLVLNRSRVIPARILFYVNGMEREIFILKRIADDVWQAMVRPGKFFGVGAEIEFKNGQKAYVVSLEADGTRLLKADFDLTSLGVTPLPPYIKNSVADDSQYQTVYAREQGSVAAPTAGLHFTENLLAKLSRKGVDIEELVLHVGRGTFLPVKSDFIEDHEMHGEEFKISPETTVNLNKSVERGKRIVAVGTTSVRVLESTFDSGFASGRGQTDIFIYPGYSWKVVGAIITNFHLPKSTLIMLVASFLESKGVKDPVRKILELYELAKVENYRFYSFGDAMFIF